MAPYPAAFVLYGEVSLFHICRKKRGELVAPDSFQRKLLPYEELTVRALGVTEQEYREIFQRIAEEQRDGRLNTRISLR